MRGRDELLRSTALPLPAPAPAVSEKRWVLAPGGGGDARATYALLDLLVEGKATLKTGAPATNANAAGPSPLLLLDAASLESMRRAVEPLFPADPYSRFYYTEAPVFLPRAAALPEASACVRDNVRRLVALVEDGLRDELKGLVHDHG